MKSGPKLDLSAIIPIGNLENDLENILEIARVCLEYGVETILVLDNQSEEITCLLETQINYLESDHLIITKGEWGNPGAPRNAGLALASRSFVTFWDSDDTPNLDGICASLLELSNREFDAILGKFWIRDGSQLHYENIFENKNPTKSMNQRIVSNPGLWRFIFNRNFIQSISFPHSSSAEDQLFLQRFFAESPNIEISLHYFYTYVQGGKAQLTRSPRVAEQTLQVTQLGINLVAQSDQEFRDLNDTLAFKQIVTILKYGTPRQILDGISLLRLFLRTVGFHRTGNAIINFVLAKLKNLLTQKPKVKVLLMGGLGNQLFQLAYGLHLRRVTGANVQLLDLARNIRRTKEGMPEVMLYKNILGVETIRPSRATKILDRAFGLTLRLSLNPKYAKNLKAKITRLGLSFLSSLRWKTVVRIFASTDLGFTKWLPEKSNYIAIGYFQSHEYLKNSQTLLELRQLKPKIIDTEVEMYKRLSEVEQPLLVHIRLGDYRNESSFGILPPAYYQEAIRTQMEQGIYKSIWVFSDENPELASYIPSKYQNAVRNIESVGNNSVSLLEVMRLCHGFVVANSTLSWWAASLAHCENPVVLYPEPWFSSLPTPNGLIPPNWIPILRS